jgi:uroporphyrinogen-III synthase
MRVLVTRPAGQASALTDALNQRGWRTDAVPLLAIEPIAPLPGQDRQRVQDLDLYDHLIFVSANAARMGLECIDEFWPQYPAGQRCWAVGASTAAVLQRAGLDVTWPEHEMNSEGLLALPGLATVDGQKVLIVRGEGGRELIAETLRQRGATVESLCCYRRHPVEHDAAALRADLAQDLPALILVSSGEGLALLGGLLQPQEHTNLARITLLVPSERVADQARTSGWQRVVRAENASDSAVLKAVDAWRDANPGENGF